MLVPDSTTGGMQYRYRCRGDWADLDSAVGRSREAITHTPDDHADLPGRLSNLGLALANPLPGQENAQGRGGE
jgi:hypothetical protein